jgi:transcription initiation factor TFIID subunit 2
MDFGTMSSKLSKGKYATMSEFFRDADLVFSNCRKFNPPGTYPVICADAVETAFRKEWSRAAQKKLASGDKRALQGIIGTIMKEDV